MKELAKRAHHLATSKTVATKNLTIFKLDPTPSNNMLVHVAKEWPNACNAFRATMFQHVSLKCCVRLPGPKSFLNSERVRALEP